MDTTLFRSEAMRRHSFSTWSSCKVNGSSLAKAGFFYTQKKDIVKCFHCGLRLGNWKDQDPVSADLNDSRKCEFMVGWACKNIPVKDYDISPMPPKVWIRSLSLTNISPSEYKKNVKAAYARRYADCTNRLRTFEELT